jgi:hypothetical protein
MELVDPDRIRLLPGQGIEAVFAAGPDGKQEVGFFLRAASRIARRNGDLGIRQRAGVIHHNDVLLVLTMIGLEHDPDSLFDIWWNYHSPGGAKHFRRMAEQERVVLHFYGEQGRDFSIDTGNGFRKFFASLPQILEKTNPWSDIEFDRAVRGFCAKSYPKENLWEMIGLNPEVRDSSQAAASDQNYQVILPEDLRPFYSYIPDQGHCIKVIPSMLEDKAVQGNPTDYLLPAPVKTVLRCGIRWVKGFPVAPIPFIPGHGLAVPPEDTEL